MNFKIKEGGSISVNVLQLLPPPLFSRKSGLRDFTEILLFQVLLYEILKTKPARYTNTKLLANENSCRKHNVQCKSMSSLPFIVVRYSFKRRIQTVNMVSHVTFITKQLFIWIFFTCTLQYSTLNQDGQHTLLNILQFRTKLNITEIVSGCFYQKILFSKNGLN